MPIRLTPLALAAALWPAPAPAPRAQDGLGAQYGARDPRPCPGPNAAPRGAPSGAQAAPYVVCAKEGVSGLTLFLVEDVRVEVGAGRPYQHVVDSFADIDPHRPVYPIRGSYAWYQCTLVAGPNGYPDRRGKNCGLSRVATAAGVCFQTTFRDWHCDMQPTRAYAGPDRDGVAPPR